MKISIVTISYNQRTFLERALRSVCEQTYPHLEYILVDAGSTDGSRELIEDFRSRLAHVVLEPDRGPADGLNKGFARATGEILGFLNSDDALLPHSLDRVARFFDRHPHVDVMSGHARIIDGDDRILRNAYSERCTPRTFAYDAGVLIQPSTFFRARAFRSVGGFNIQNRCGWDAELFVDMMLEGARFEIVDEFLSCYRLHEESITSSMKLAPQLAELRLSLFRKVMRRDPTRLDRFMKLAYRVRKHVTNPRALYERLAKGPIYGYHAAKRGVQ
jgi:glycosyltransferase involved in cell wall biosynthesis